MPSLKNIDLSGNDFTDLQESVHQWPNLTNFILSSNRVSTVGSGALYNPDRYWQCSEDDNLKIPPEGYNCKVDLSFNNIMGLAEDAFGPLLEEGGSHFGMLDLSGIPMTELREEQFKYFLDYNFQISDSGEVRGMYIVLA